MRIWISIQFHLIRKFHTWKRNITRPSVAKLLTEKRDKKNITYTRTHLDWWYFEYLSIEMLQSILLFENNKKKWGKKSNNSNHVEYDWTLMMRHWIEVWFIQIYTQCTMLLNLFFGDIRLYSRSWRPVESIVPFSIQLFYSNRTIALINLKIV